jgi:tetratricopeptide (TPR) repeat protein
MDLLEQRALMRLIASDMAGSAADFRAFADLAQQVGAPDRRIRALLDSTLPLLFVDYRQISVALDEAEAALATSDDRIFGALTASCRMFFQMYFHGWTQELGESWTTVCSTLGELPDLRHHSRVACVQAAVFTFASEYAAAEKVAEASRVYARKSGVFFDYFVATMYLQWAVFHRGDLGQAIRIARDAGELAAKNGSRIPRLWFRTREAWVHMEAFDFDWALKAFEENARILFTVTTRPNSFPLYLWLGVAEMGRGDYAGAWNYFEKVRMSLAEGGMAFQLMCPLIRAQAECMLSQSDLVQAESLARELIQVAREHHQPDYEAEGYRLMAQVASAKGATPEASTSILQAIALLDRVEAWVVEWRVHAAAAQIFARSGRQVESENSRRRSRAAADRVAASLAAEPDLQQSFMKRVNGDAAASA